MIPKIATMNKYNHKSQNKRSIDAHRSLLRCVTCRRFLNMVIKPMPTVFAFNCSKWCGTIGIISDVLQNKKMLPFFPGINLLGLSLLLDLIAFAVDTFTFQNHPFNSAILMKDAVSNGPLV